MSLAKRPCPMRPRVLSPQSSVFSFIHYATDLRLVAIELAGAKFEAIGIIQFTNVYIFN